MGINLWFAPQISEHWPKKTPHRLTKNITWFNRPGIASVFTPKEGTLQEWMTSEPVATKQMYEFKGRTKELSTSNKRNLLSVMYESKSTFKKSLYSYDQYHWYPTLLTTTLNLKLSSSIYSACKDGTAIKTKTTAGQTVQITSIKLFSVKLRCVIPLKKIE